jgi:hypothetical protein
VTCIAVLLGHPVPWPTVVENTVKVFTLRIPTSEVDELHEYLYPHSEAGSWAMREGFFVDPTEMAVIEGTTAYMYKTFTIQDDDDAQEFVQRFSKYVQLG